MRIPAIWIGATALALSVFGQPACDGGPFTCGTTISGVISDGSCPTGCQELSQIHTFNTFGNTTLASFTLSPDGFTPVIEIETPGGQLIERKEGRAGEALRLGAVLQPGVYHARVIARPAGATGSYTLRLGCLLADPQVFCTPDETTLCLYNRFAVNVAIKVSEDDPPVAATARRGSDRYGLFTAPSLTSDPDNPEVMVKVLDGRPVNDRWWVFYGGLSGFDWELTVRDTFFKREKTYTKADIAEDGGLDLVTFSDR